MNPLSKFLMCLIVIVLAVISVSAQSVGLYVLTTSQVPSGSNLMHLQHYVFPPATPAAGIAIPTTVTNGTYSASWKIIDDCSNTAPCAHGSYNWAPFDNIVTGLGCSSCKIGIIVQPASDSGSDSATPLYVTNAVSPLTCNSSSSHIPYINQPALWEPPGIAAYQSWATEIVRHFTPGYDSYSASYASQVSYVRFGLFVGGEALLPCPYQALATLGAYNLTIPALSAYTSSLFSSITALKPPFLVEGPVYGGDPALNPAYCGAGAFNSYCITQDYADTEAAAEISNGAGIGTESLSVLTSNWYAEGQICSSDICNLFNQYIGSAPMFGWQLFSESNPSCDPWNLSSCGSQTGSLVNILPFATIRMHAGQPPKRLNVLEIYWQDWMCAYYGSVDGNCPTTLELPFIPYQHALSNASLLSPTGTSSLTGNSNSAGTAAMN